MGLFGGDKKKKQSAGGDDDRRKRSRSRRVVAPGAKRGAGSGSDSSDSGGGEKNKHATSRVKRGHGRKSAPANGEQKAAPSREPAQEAPVQARNDDVLELDLEASSGGHQMIDVGDTGHLDGVNRTGDAALLDFLVNKANLLIPEQVAQVEDKAHQDMVSIDVACTHLGLFTEDQLVKSLTEECWVPHLKVEKYAIRKKALDTVSQTDAITYGVLPVDKLGSILNLAMVNPLDTETIRMLEQKTGLDIKKVVATRSEIEAGIAKYYGGEGGADDGTLGIEQDIPSQRVTQMLANLKAEPDAPDTDPAIMAAVQAQQEEPAAAAMEPAPTPEPPPAAEPAAAEMDEAPSLGGDDLDDIVDIDDLLGADEAIEPVAVQPISISEDEFEADEDGDLVDATVTSIHAKQKDLTDEYKPATDQMVASPDISQPSAELELMPDEEDEVIEPAIDLAAAQDADDEEFEELVEDDEQPAEPAVSAAPPVAERSAAPASVQPMPSQPAAAMPAPVKRKTIVDLVAVREEEFQHAISHGKARVFEKWVAIQTRNRILNAVPVEPALDEVLAPLYAEPTVAASLD